MSKKQLRNHPLFFSEDDISWWKPFWENMPEFRQENKKPYRTLYIHFRSKDDLQEFLQLINQQVTKDTKSIWYPKLERKVRKDKEIVGRQQGILPKYPIYIISKGRWESRLTVKALETMQIPYRIVIEPQEQEKYAAVIDPKKILVLPFSNLGQGSIPARNWVWEHSLANGDKRHWILDDNIKRFERLQENMKILISDGSIFRFIEEFTDRYENIALSGPNYDYLVKQNDKVPSFYLNTRVFSCILIKNDMLYRWRGKYNEDTDLSLRVLKDGWVTILFNSMLCNKVPTLRMKGGNMDELYQGDGRLKMAESLRDQHPDCATIIRKWGRWQHQVDYRPFKRNKLKRRIDTEKSDIDFEFILQERKI